MQHTKHLNKKENPKGKQEKEMEQKLVPQQRNRMNPAKFSRQTQTKIKNLDSGKTSLLVPSLNLIKINQPKPQKISSKDLQSPNYDKYRLNVPTTKQTNEPTTPNRKIEANNPSSPIQISPSSISKLCIQSPIQSLLKSQRSKVDSDSFMSEADKEELLILEIKQLKQQNTFLKKKIRDLKKQLNGGFLPQDFHKKSPSNNQSPIKKQKKGFPVVNIESLHLSANLFFEEIKNLLNSVTMLFKIQFSEEEVKEFKQMHKEEQIIEELKEEICPLRKHEILKKFYLKRKLEKLALEEEQKKFDSLLSIFSEYYTFKQLSEKKVVQTIDQMVMYTSDLNRWLIEKAYAKRSKSEVQSHKKSPREMGKAVSPPKFDSLKVSSQVNYVKKGRGLSVSPNVKRN